MSRVRLCLVMVRFSTLLLLLCSIGQFFAQEEPRVEILRSSKLDDFGAQAFGEGRNGRFLLIESGPSQNRILSIDRRGRRQLLRRIDRGALPNYSGIFAASEDGGWIGSHGTGLISVDRNGTPTMLAVPPVGFGSTGSEFVEGEDGAYYGLSEESVNQRAAFYRWTSADGFVVLHSFQPYTGNSRVIVGQRSVVSSLFLGRAGGFFAIRRESVPAPQPAFSGQTVPAFALERLSAAGDEQLGPYVLDASASGLSELPDGRVVTVAVFQSGTPSETHVAFGAFDAAGNFTEITSLDSYLTRHTARLLGVLPSSGSSVVALDDDGGTPSRLAAISPSGAVAILPLGTGGDTLYPGLFVLAHDGNLYGTAYRAKPDFSADRKLFLRVVDLQPAPVNLPPIARDDTIEAPRALAGGDAVEVTFSPLGNDSDADYDPLTIENAEVASPLIATISTDRRHITVVFPSGSLPVASVKYQIGDGQGGTATANASVSLPTNAGRFCALTHAAPEAADIPPPLPGGYLDVQISRLGRVTGSFWFEGIRYFIRGQFGGEGGLDVLLPVGSLHLQREGRTVHGEIHALGHFPLELTATEARRPAPGLVGRYTSALRPSEPFAGQAVVGIGWSIVTVKSSGRVVIAGRMGDGSRLLVGSRLDGLGRFPIYTGLRRVTQPNQFGHLSGSMALQPGASLVGSSVLEWWTASSDLEIPEIFQGSVTMLVSRYTPASTSQPALAGLAADGKANLTLGVTFLPNSSKVPVQVQGELITGEFISGRISRTDGRISIRVPHRAMGGILKLQGVVLQGFGDAEGLFMTKVGRTTTAGSFTLVPK